MLEKLNQKKVSLLIDSMDKWAKLGFPITNDTTIVRIKKTSQDLSIAPTNYPLNFRQGIIIKDLKSTHGLFPKVLIASSKDVPDSKESNVVHVQYADLLNEIGTPKPAKELWNILVKAGVPRYAELVCISDDPGEAAINYFILRLMGYPDIKVLIN